MPSLFRFLFLIALVSGATFGGLYLISEYFEPDQKEITQSVPGVKIRR